MLAFVQTPVLPEATAVRALPAQLRRPSQPSATSASRRLRPAGTRPKAAIRETSCERVSSTQSGPTIGFREPSRI